MTILSKHYYPHYQQLFVPFINFFLSIYCLLGRSKFLVDGKISTHKVFTILLVLALITSSRLEIYSILKSVSKINQLHPHENTLTDIKVILNEHLKTEDSISFLDTSHMYSHWRLNQSRHGFPHAANFRHIEIGRWDKLNSESKKLTNFPYSSDEICHKLKLAGPNIIFTKNNTIAQKCLSKRGSSYKQLVLPSLKTPELVVYVRRNKI